METAYER
jgi:hypothetical protein